MKRAGEERIASRHLTDLTAILSPDFKDLSLFGEISG